MPIESVGKAAGMRPNLGTADDSGAIKTVLAPLSRGPLRERLFGGCTKSVLSGGELPVLVVH